MLAEDDASNSSLVATVVRSVNAAIKLHSQKLSLACDVKKTVIDNLTGESRRALELAGRRGASSRLTVLPESKFGFALSKSDTRDAICILYVSLC